MSTNKNTKEAKTGKKACKENKTTEQSKETQQDTDVLINENSQLKEQLSKSKEDYLRLMAEFENFRRRTSEEKLSLIGSASSDIIKGILPVMDDCERALELLDKSSDSAAKEGTALIYDKLMNYLKTKGLEKIESKGAKFDTDVHEAIAQIPAESEDKKGIIHDVIVNGYLLNGKVIRYAKVVVGI